jgi:hypothetical protein
MNLDLIYDKDMNLNCSLVTNIVVVVDDDFDDEDDDVKHRNEITHFDDDVNDE